jgi:hypothetical protein
MMMQGNRAGCPDEELLLSNLWAMYWSFSSRRGVSNAGGKPPGSTCRGDLAVNP